MEIIEAYDTVWLDEHRELPLAVLVELSGLSREDLQQLVDCEMLTPVKTAEPAAEARFGAHSVSIARAASRLRNDFDLNENGLLLALQLLNRIHALEAELNHLRAQTSQI